MIRAATVEDISFIVRIRRAALSEGEIRGFSAPEFWIYSSIEELRKVWERKNRLIDGFEVFVAEDEKKMVGFIVCKIERDYGYIANIVVAKEEQRKGIGRALVEYVELIAESKGCYLMKTDITENVDGVPWKAYGFWIRMGYKDPGQRLPIKNYGFEEISLIKRLN